MYLKEGSLLRNGRYRVERTLGLGGFGITYLGLHIAQNRQVAIKEFFMKDLCNRDESTLCVTVPSVGSKELVDKFKAKFIKEAQIITELSHANIIKIYDVFEENGTAYYVMEYHERGSLNSLLDLKGALSTGEALMYIWQIADALDYLHNRSINHLDVKPANILISNDNYAVLIDFGLSKHYDCNGFQTTTTPVGISHGYAPLEQYKKGGVGEFSPTTDIYSLGATLYKLITGITPPEASDVYDSGLPAMPETISVSLKRVIESCMQPKRKDRPQSIDELRRLFDADLLLVVLKESANRLGLEIQANGKSDITSEDTVLVESEPELPKSAMGSNKVIKFILLGVLLVVLFVVGVIYLKKDRMLESSVTTESTLILDNSDTEHKIHSDEVKDNVVEPEVQQLNPGSLSKPVMSKVSSESINGMNIRWGLGVSASQKEILRDLIRNMVRVERGSFIMGDDSSEYYKPAHKVTLSDFYINKFEVTRKEWNAVMGIKSSEEYSDSDSYPVVKVSWNDIVEKFLRELNRLTGLTFRLPTEAEWEFAARGGNLSKGYKYSGGNELDEVAWYDGNSGGTRHPVGEKRANELGLYDMSGNVYELCNDFWGEYSASPQTNPKGPYIGADRIARGGSWYYGDSNSEVSCRGGYEPTDKRSHVGFRLAL